MAGAAQLAMFAKQNEQDAWKGIGDTIDKQRSANLAKALAKYGDLSQEGVTKFAQQYGLNLADPKDMALVSNAQDTAKKFFDFARSKKEAAQNDTLFGYQSKVAENQVNRIPVENQRSDTLFDWQSKDRGYNVDRRATADQQADAQAEAETRLRNAQAGYYEGGGPTQQMTEAERKFQAEKDRKIKEAESYRLASGLNKQLASDKGSFGRIVYDPETETFSGRVTASKAADVQQYFEQLGFGVDLAPTGQDYDVPGKFWDEPEYEILNVYKIEQPQAALKEDIPGGKGQEKTEYDGLLNRGKSGMKETKNPLVQPSFEQSLFDMISKGAPAQKKNYQNLLTVTGPDSLINKSIR